MALRRAAIYGGTFDPVHNGHLEVARRVQKLFALDEVIFVPACVPPHKRGAGITLAFHRLAMLALATEHDDRLRVSTLELEQPDRPYAVETVARMQERLGGDARLFFIMGADSWSEISTWRDWRRLLTMCDHIVVTRPGYESLATLDGFALANTRGLSPEEMSSVTDDAERPGRFLTDVVFKDVSSTAIRSAARQGKREELRQMVTPAVADYIEKYELYVK